MFDTLLEHADQTLQDGNGQRVAWPIALAGDKGYRADWIDEYLLQLGIQRVIPTAENQDRDKRPVKFNKRLYRCRHIIENLIGWLNESRRIFTRYEKTTRNFAGMIKWACLLQYLRYDVKIAF